jgi:hypothetical protein
MRTPAQIAARKALWYQVNKTTITPQQQSYQQSHPKQTAATKRRYYLAHRAECIARSQACAARAKTEKSDS